MEEEKEQGSNYTENQDKKPPKSSKEIKEPILNQTSQPQQKSSKINHTEDESKKESKIINENRKVLLQTNMIEQLKSESPVYTTDYADDKDYYPEFKIKSPEFLDEYLENRRKVFIKTKRDELRSKTILSMESIY